MRLRLGPRVKRVLAGAAFLLVTVMLAFVVPRPDPDPVGDDAVQVRIEGDSVWIRYQPTETGYVSFRFSAYTRDDLAGTVVLERYVIPGLFAFPGYGEPTNCAVVPLDVFDGKPFRIVMRKRPERFSTIARVESGLLVPINPRDRLVP